MTDYAQIHTIPFNGFAFADTTADDLCIRTLSSDQKIIVSPAASNPDTDAATMTVQQGHVNIAGSLATLRLTTSDMQTLGLRLMKSASSSSYQTSSNQESYQSQNSMQTRLRICLAGEDSNQVPSTLCDIFIVTSATQQRVFSILGGTTINGRKLTLKNCLETGNVVLRVMGLDGTTLLSLVTVAPGQETSLYGYHDRWF